MVNWTSVLILCIVSIGGWIAVVYETIAMNRMIPIGHFFKKNGIMTILGGIIALIAAVTSVFINPWWTIFVILVISWLFSQIFIMLFRVYSQLLSIILIIGGIIFFILKTL